LRQQLEDTAARHGDALKASAGRSVLEARGDLDDARAALAAAEQAADDVERLQGLVHLVEHRQAELAAREAEIARDLVAKQTQVEERSTQAADGRETLASRIGAGVTVEERIAATRSALERTRAVLTATRDLADRTRVLDDRTSHLDDALSASPFHSADEVLAGRMTKPDLANAEALIQAAEARRVLADQTLARPEIVAAASADPPDLVGLKSSVDATGAAHRAASAAADRLAERSERLERLGTEFEQALAENAPLLERRALAASVAGLCAGTSPENTSRIRLSHYVLSTRLQQVVDAANLRLGSIASGRYQLQHSMHRGVGDTRGGLGLLVLDTYTGQARDPATLSGGETFYVSLALALGLADLVRDEIGGVELSTLFVDEGFGSLDAETLDEVMDELDSLRSGGRAVGIVSHLSELRQRVPARVNVVAGQSGSRIRTG
jgi:exonuclease SbcC